MTAIEDPVEYDITVRIDTDHAWSFRRIDGNNMPLVPTEAKAEIRSFTNKELWAELTCLIVDNGWIHVYLGSELVDYPTWRTRFEGEWDLLVTYNGSQYKWVAGLVTVDDGVTRG